MTNSSASKRRKPAVTEEDLAWFDLTNYAPERLQQLGLRGWLQVLGDRLCLRQGINNGRHDIVLMLFEQLKSDPTRALIGTVGPIIGSDPSDTPAVFSARALTLEHFAEDAKHCDMAPFDIYDFKKAELDPGVTPPFVTVHINLCTSKERIRENFNAWLDAVYGNHPVMVLPGQSVPKRRRAFSGQATPLAEWAEHKYLPFYDLELYAEAIGKSVPQEMMFNMLDMDSDLDPSDALKAPRKSRKVFTFATALNMWLHLDPAIAQQQPPR